MRRVSWVFRLLLGINILFGILLLFSLSSVYIDPTVWWLPALAGLSFLQIFLVNVLFLFFWLVFRKKYALYSMVFLIFGLTEITNHVQLNLEESPTDEEFHIMSLNVRNFDLYNWSENKKTRNRILQLIKSKHAEIICLQEFFNTTNPKHDFKTLDTILKFDSHYWSHVEYTSTVKETEHWGIATFTTFPVVRKGKVNFKEKSNNICIFTDILIDRDTFRIYNMHLASVRFGHEDYAYLNEVVDRNKDPNVTSSMSLITKLKNAYLKRSEQVKDIQQHMANSHYPVILCGDFNDTPTSFAYNTLKHGLNDTFRKKGNGFGSTYNGKLPFLRIDYILADPRISILKHEVIHGDISDHYPIFASLEIKK